MILIIHLLGRRKRAASRWLAQLAVNIVDFIDTDDYITPFNWFGSGATAEYVYGTELPRVLINEAYAQYTPPPPNMSSNPTTVNVWVELMNPFRTIPRSPKVALLDFITRRIATNLPFATKVLSLPF